MVAWFKHDIPAWMDGTASLSDSAYRAYHVICQQIYLNEGPIALNERMLAGACNQSLKAFRLSLKELLEAGKLTQVDGRLDNSRAALELLSVEKNRINARDGGINSGKVRNKAKNDNENNVSNEATLQEDRSLKTRLEKTREEEAPLAPSTPEKDYFARCRQVLGEKHGGSLGARLLSAKSKNVAIARAAIETASTKHKPSEYIGAIINRRDAPEDLRARGEAW